MPNKRKYTDDDYQFISDHYGIDMTIEDLASHFNIKMKSARALLTRVRKTHQVKHLRPEYQVGEQRPRRAPDGKIYMYEKTATGWKYVSKGRKGRPAVSRGGNNAKVPVGTVRKWFKRGRWEEYVKTETGWKYMGVVDRKAAARTKKANEPKMEELKARKASAVMPKRKQPEVHYAARATPFNPQTHQRVWDNDRRCWVERKRAS